MNTTADQRARDLLKMAEDYRYRWESMLLENDRLRVELTAALSLVTSHEAVLRALGKLSPADKLGPAEHPETQ